MLLILPKGLKRMSISFVGNTELGMFEATIVWTSILVVGVLGLQDKDDKRGEGTEAFSVEPRVKRSYPERNPGESFSKM